MTPSTVVDSAEGKFATVVSGEDYRASFPPVATEPVVSAKPGPHGSGAGSVEPLALVALGTPLAHLGDVGDEVVYDIGWGSNVDAEASPLRRRHRISISSGVLDNPDHGRFSRVIRCAAHIADISLISQ